MKHEWIEVGARRWCLACGSFQIKRHGKWRDDQALLGSWPGYNPTQEEYHVDNHDVALGK